MESILTRNQKKTFRAEYIENGQPHIIIAEVRYDDQCGNGHNSFSVTADLYGPDRQSHEPKLKSKSGKTLWLFAGGCCHEEIEKHLPELRELIKWHFCNSDGPMHYIENASYWAGLRGHGKPNDPPNESNLKSTIIYGAVAGDEQVNPMKLAKAGQLTDWLQARLPELLIEFRKAVESVGFTY